MAFSDEHYRRSPDCRFFTFAGTTAPKASRGKKGRASKTSRLSTQSNATVASEAQDIPHFDDSIDTTTVSVDVIAPSVTKAAVKGAKGTKAKGRETRKLAHLHANQLQHSIIQENNHPITCSLAFTTLYSKNLPTPRGSYHPDGYFLDFSLLQTNQVHPLRPN